MIFILLVIPLAFAKVYPRTGVDGTSNIQDEVEGVLYEIPEYEDPDLTLYRLSQRGAFPVITVMEVAKETKDLAENEGAKHHLQINGVRTELNDAMAQLYIAKTKLEKGDEHISMDIDKTIYFLMNLKHRLDQETGMQTSQTKTSSSDAFPKHSFFSDVLAEQHLPFVVPKGQLVPSKKQLPLSNTYDIQFSQSEAPFESSTSDALSATNSSTVPSETTTTESISSVKPFFAVDSLSKKYSASKFALIKYLASRVAEQRFPSSAAATEQPNESDSSDEQNLTLTTTTPASKYSALDSSEYKYLGFDSLIQKPNKVDHSTQQPLSLENPKMKYVISDTSVEPVTADFFSSEKRLFNGESSSTDPSFSTESLDTDSAAQEEIPEGLHDDGLYIAGTNKHEIKDKAAIRKKWSWISPEIEKLYNESL